VTKPYEDSGGQARVRSLLKAKAYADAVKERWASELRIAHEIRLGLLPSTRASSPRLRPDIEGVLQPAQGVGGDFYEVLRTTNRPSPVRDRGARPRRPAAMLMAITLTVIRMMAVHSSSRSNPTLGEDALAVHWRQGLTVTLFCGVYEQSSGQLTCRERRHPPPAVRRDGRVILWPQEASERWESAGLGPRPQCHHPSARRRRAAVTNGVLDATLQTATPLAESR